MTADTIVRVDPKTLLIGANVRKETTLPAEFVASVKEHGVKIPIVAHETTAGLEVVDGQMRTLAAMDAGLKEVPVFVRATVEGGERLVEQLVVNRERTALSRADTIAAVRELALDFKMPAAAVAKKVGIPAAEVKQVLIVAKDENATTALAETDVSLEIAAKMAEAGLTKDEIAKVTNSNWNREHALQQVLDQRVAAARTEELQAELAAAGVPLAAKPSKGDYNVQEKNKHLFLTGVVEKETDKKITPEEHASCPGHAAWVGVRGYGGKVEIHYLCTDPSKFGHRDADRQAPKKLSEAEKVERAENAAAAKVWPSIVEVRQTWIREQLLTRKAMPAGWEQLESWVVLGQAGNGGEYDWGPFAATLLGITEKGYGSSAVAKWAAANPTKVVTLLVAVAIAKVELSVGDSKSWKGWRGRKIADYLDLLNSWGYGLSELEQSIVDAAKKGKKAA